MAMTKPVGVEVSTFDAIKPQIFSFTVSGGNQVVKNKLTITDSNNVVVYENTQTTYAFSQSVPANTFTNGNRYWFFFKTYDIYNTESESSDPLSFYCIGTPTITFNNLESGDVIKKSSYTFDITYEQAQDEKIEGLQFVLYDINNEKLSTSSTYTSNSTPPLNFTHTFYGFENTKEYKIGVEGITIHGLKFKTSLYQFVVTYENPEDFVQFDVFNMCEEGYNQIKSNLKYIEGTANFEPVEYIDDTKVNLLDITLNKKVTFTNRELVESDFVMQVWFGVGILGKLFTLSNEEGNVYFEGKFLREVPYGETKTKDCVEIYGYIDGEEVFYKRSNYIELTNNTANLVLYFKYNPTNRSYIVRLYEYDKVDNFLSAGTIDIIYNELVTNNNDNIITDDDDYILAGQVDYSVLPNSNIEYNRLTNIRYKKFEPYEASEQKPSLYGDMTVGYPFTKFEIFNGIYDAVYITTDINMDYTIDVPQWGYDTCLRCLFENNLLGGNTGDLDLSILQYFKIKTRIQGTFDWIMTYNIPFDIDNLKFIVDDYIAPSGVTMEYAFVPVYEGDIEGSYTIVTQYTQWSRLFVTDTNGDTMSLVGNVNLSSLTSNGSFGTLLPIASKYPIVINNSQNDFESGTISGTVLSDDISESLTRENRRQIVEKRDKWNAMLKNGDAKIIKDWNGFIWIARVTSSPTYQTSQTMANGYGNISFSFVEQGKWNNYQDLIRNGFSLIVDTSENE